MGRDCSTTFTWADGDYTFRLNLGQLRELQEKCDAGPQELYNRIAREAWRVDDLRETIRLGLIGGGMKPDKALTLVRRYVDERPWMESMLPAQLILQASLVGVPDEEPGKAQAAEESGQAASSQEGSSPSPPSMEQAP